MYNTNPYTDRIKKIALSKGEVLSDDQALEMLARVSEFAKVIINNSNNDYECD
jgi:hypothetical protein